MNQEKWLLGSALVVAAMALSLNAARADYVCPPPATSCKVVIVTPQELQSLEGPGMIFDSAVFANRMQLTGLVEAWKQKIEASPAGVVKPAESPKEPKKEPPKK